RARIGGSVDCSGGRFLGGGNTINLVEAAISGDAVFHQDFTTDGIIDLRLAKIGRSLSFNHAHFAGTGDNGVNAERAAIDGPLYWVDIEHTPRTMLDLENASATALWDDRASWPAKGNLVIDGFHYGGFGGDAPADAKTRLKWLALQPGGFHPQPYAELAQAQRADGMIEDATSVMIAQRVAQRRHGGLRFAERAWNAILEVTIGYGFRPLRALWWMAAFVALGTILFRFGYDARMITPIEQSAYETFSETGEPPPFYPAFNAFVYSLDNFLPVVELHQCDYWRPNPLHRTKDGQGARPRVGSTILRWYLWAHILAGWTLMPLLFAGLSGLIRVE
ncbi:MAG TPA: hypothetical protein VEF03_00690, partial [Candidatus Binataceae bacterium]|nr:hypothetical protein [Candidatus Binataceae bacterium]